MLGAARCDPRGVCGRLAGTPCHFFALAHLQIVWRNNGVDLVLHCPVRERILPMIGLKPRAIPSARGFFFVADCGLF